MRVAVVVKLKEGFLVYPGETDGLTPEAVTQATVVATNSYMHKDEVGKIVCNLLSYPELNEKDIIFGEEDRT